MPGEPLAASAKSNEEFLSVWTGSDAGLLDRLLDFYPASPVQTILDCTYNAGRIWKGSRFRGLITSMDIDPAHEPDLIDDNRIMGEVPDKSFDVVVYDPPHVPNQGRDRSKDFQKRFGLTSRAGKADGYSLDSHHQAVLVQCRRVLKPGGLVLAKIADYVHNHTFHWSSHNFVAACRTVGLTPCDCLVKVRAGPIQDPRWQTRHHARRCHVYWIVVRNANTCERRTPRRQPDSGAKS